MCCLLLASSLEGATGWSTINPAGKGVKKYEQLFVLVYNSLSLNVNINELSK